MNRVLSTILIITILGMLGALGYVLTTPSVGEMFTSFYILGQNGKAADYPEELGVGESSKIVVGITNNEHQDMSYHVAVTSAESLITGYGPVKLQHGQTYEQEVDIILFTPGEAQKVEFLLFREGENEAYRLLHLWIDIIDQE